MLFLSFAEPRCLSGSSAHLHRAQDDVYAGTYTYYCSMIYKLSLYNCLLSCHVQMEGSMQSVIQFPARKPVCKFLSRLS
jgi:hypothetical protein